MNASGVWRGRCQGRLGNFKFINLEVLPEKCDEICDIVINRDPASG